MSGAEKLFDAITEVREDLVEEALDYRFPQKKPIPWQRYVPLAACLALVVCIGYLAANLRMGGMNAAGNDGSNGTAAGDAADAGDSTGAAPEDGNTADGAMPPPNDAGGGTGEAAPAHGSTVPALSLAEEDRGVEKGVPGGEEWDIENTSILLEIATCETGDRGSQKR